MAANDNKGGFIMADKPTIAVQKGLSEIEKFLKEKGYAVCVMGNCAGKADINIVEIQNSDWEEISSAECRLDGDKEVLVINAAKHTNEEILKLVENNMCKKPESWIKMEL